MKNDAATTENVPRFQVKYCGYKSVALRDASIVRYIIDHDATTREAAVHFHLGKSTIYDIAEKYLLTHDNVYTKKLIETFRRHTERSKRAFREHRFKKVEA